MCPAKIHERDEEVKKWDELGLQAVGDQEKPDDFANGRLAEDQAALIGYQFVTQLAKNGSRFNKLLKMLREGERFETAIEKNYQMGVVEMVTGKAPAEKPRR